MEGRPEDLFEHHLNQAPVPLVPMGNVGPPKIIEIQEKYTAVEGNFG